MFTSAARLVGDFGMSPLLTWGPGEEGLVHEIARSVPKAVSAPPTTIDELAALIQQARATICNNTGPDASVGRSRLSDPRALPAHGRGEMGTQLCTPSDGRSDRSNRQPQLGKERAPGRTGRALEGHFDAT